MEKVAAEDLNLNPYHGVCEQRGGTLDHHKSGVPLKMGPLGSEEKRGAMKVLSP